MADNDTELPPDIDFEGEAAPAVRTTPLTMEERLIVQNLFDTQPKRRKQYMEQLGFELDPSDTNKYRPLGSQLDFTAEIDPGISVLYTPGGLGKKIQAIAKETGMDVLDLLGDVGQSFVSAAGQKAGASAGAMAGSKVPVVGNVIGGLLGGITGGALGQAVADEAKEHIGNLYLDKNIPDDMKMRAVSALMAGFVPVAMQGMGKGVKQLKSGWLAMRAKSISNAAQSSAGVTDELLNKAVKSPEMFTPEAVDGATKRLGETYKGIFGVADNTVATPKSTRAIAPDSVFGQAVKPLNQQADAELNRLALEPAANWKASDLLGPINSKIDELASKFSRSAEEDAALKYLKGKKSFIENKAKEVLAAGPARAKESVSLGGIPITGKKASVTAPKAAPRTFDEDAIMNTEFDFKQGRQFLKTIQDDAFNRELPGSSILSQYAGGLRQAADAKAGALGSKLPEINAKRSEILGLFEQAKTALSPQKLTQAFIGDDTIAKQETQLLLQRLEQAGVAPGISNAVETGAMQRVLENAYKNPKPFGSGRVMGSMMSEGLSGGLKGAGIGGFAGSTVGAPVPGAVIGGLTGLVSGAKRGAMMARPEVAIPALTENLAKQRALEAAMAAPLQQQASQLTQQAGAAAARNIIAPETLPPEEEELPDIEW
jgi:hypothetical protein